MYSSLSLRFCIGQNKTKFKLRQNWFCAVCGDELKKIQKVPIIERKHRKNIRINYQTSKQYQTVMRIH